MKTNHQCFLIKKNNYSIYCKVITYEKNAFEKKENLILHILFKYRQEPLFSFLFHINVTNNKF